MYPTISDAIRDLFGINIPLPFPTFGFFVALAFLVGAYFFSKELKRKEKSGLLQATYSKVRKGEKASTSDLFFNALFGFVIGFKVLEMFLHYGDLVADPQTFILSTRGNFLGGVLGAALFAYLKYRDKEKEKLEKPVTVEEKIRPHEHVGNMTLIAAVGGILGAKIFHNLENFQDFTADPIGALLSFSGLSIYGGIIVGGAAVLYYAHKKGMSIVHVADASAPGLILAYGIGRIGCQVAGDGDWGMPNDAPMPDWLSFLPNWTWAYDYPNNVLNVNLQDYFQSMGLESITGRAWPTPFYESIMAFIVFGILWSLRKKISVPGVLFSLYMLLNGIERFMIEKIRINPNYHFLGIEATQAEIIAVLMMLFGLIGIFYFKNNKNKYLSNSRKNTD